MPGGCALGRNMSGIGAFFLEFQGFFMSYSVWGIGFTEGLFDLQFFISDCEAGYVLDVIFFPGQGHAVHAY